MPSKAYFLINDEFDSTQNSASLNIKFNFRSFKVDGIEQIDYNVYDVETVPSTFKPITTYNRTQPNFQSLENVEPWNIWNPFYDCMNMEFDTLGFYGQCTGTQSGNSYGGWETSIYVDKLVVTDGTGAPHYGAFGIEFDETKDLEFRINIASQVELIGTYTAANQSYTYVENWSNGFIVNNKINLGWLDLDLIPFVTAQEGNVQKYIGTALPVPQTEEDDRGFDVCCPCSIVLADTIDVDEYKNDFFGANHYKQSGESVIWKVFKNGIEISYAAFATVSVFSKLETFTFNWADVLNTEGEDLYYVTKTIRINGFDLYDQNYNTVKLKTFTWELANGTVRMDSHFDNKLDYLGYSFKNTGFKHSMRVTGSFGSESPELITESNYNTEFKNINNYKRIENSYNLEIDGIRDCIWMDFPEFYLLADTLKITDYNQRSYSYRYKTLPVVLESFEESEYTGSSRQAVHRMVFKEKQLNKISSYG